MLNFECTIDWKPNYKSGNFMHASTGIKSPFGSPCECIFCPLTINISLLLGILPSLLSFEEGKLHFLSIIAADVWSFQLMSINVIKAMPGFGINWQHRSTKEKSYAFHEVCAFLLSRKYVSPVERSGSLFVTFIKTLEIIT